MELKETNMNTTKDISIPKQLKKLKLQYQKACGLWPKFCTVAPPVQTADALHDFYLVDGWCRQNNVKLLKRSDVAQGDIVFSDKEIPVQQGEECEGQENASE
jgi:hypothetical protein